MNDDLRLPIGETTLKEAQDWLRERLESGAECPCCHQLAKIYPRKIHTSMASLLIRVYRKHGRGEFYMPDAGTERQTTDAAKLRYWALIENIEGRRDDGSNRTGWWRITPRGEQYVLDGLALPKYARIYNHKPYGFAGEDVTIIDALGSRFAYDELMAGI